MWSEGAFKSEADMVADGLSENPSYTIVFLLGGLSYNVCPLAPNS